MDNVSVLSQHHRLASQHGIANTIIVRTVPPCLPHLDAMALHMDMQPLFNRC